MQRKKTPWKKNPRKISDSIDETSAAAATATAAHRLVLWKVIAALPLRSFPYLL